MRTILVACLMAGIATPVMAADRTGYRAIATGDLKGAEQRLLAERRIFPERPELMLNLAVVYGQTGRLDAARGLYAAVLDRPAVAMSLPTGDSVSSHEIAQRGLSRLTPAMMATR